MMKRHHVIINNLYSTLFGYLFVYLFIYFPNYYFSKYILLILFDLYLKLNQLSLSFFITSALLLFYFLPFEYLYASYMQEERDMMGRHPAD